jgi:hypothetical protein
MGQYLQLVTVVGSFTPTVMFAGNAAYASANTIG